MRTRTQGARRAQGQAAIALLATTAILGLAACSSSGGSTSSAAASGCTPAHKFTTLKKGTLSVVTEDALPYGGVKSGKLNGVDGAIVNAIAKMECLSVDAKLVDGSAVIPSVQTGKVDVGMGDWYRTPERLKTIQMSDGMYLDQNGFISKSGVSTFEALRSLKVGARSGVNFDDALQKYLGGKLVLYATGPNLYQDLKLGRLDVVVDSAGAAHVAVGTADKIEVPASIPASMGTSFDPTAAGLPVNSKDTGLQDALNADLATMRSNGTLVKLVTANGLPASSINVGSK